MIRLQLLLVTLILSFTVSSKEHHVSKNGDDKNPGIAETPFLTIQEAANVAQLGDLITVHKGVYREWIKPAK